MTTSNDIAIVGIALRLPGAADVDAYWHNLRNGVESVTQLSESELLEAGATVADVRDPEYVPFASRLDGVYDFDPEFFGFSPKDAGIMDPQHRQFLMASWEALEDAGHPPESVDGSVGVFAGCGTNAYYVNNILTNHDLVRDVGLFLLRHTGNDKDFLATRASYLLDLHGPAINVQTACSTSLVATHLAVNHLLSGEVDLALAGGVTIEVPHGLGYRYHAGEILSPDGHCRPFDHRSAGTVFGSGVGVVVLRRLDDALADGDRIYSVIKATAVNNDGARKVGYLAPSVDGQAACIAEALAVADIDARSIGYVECHGTGTAVGDPIEVAALTQGFATSDTTDVGYCRIGSVKSNIGHLDTAAGVASLIKASLALYHGEIPPSLNFEAPNPLLGLDSSPFLVADALAEFPSFDGGLRRAAVNSLGVGGTNAFAVLEQAPAGAARVPAATDGWHLLQLSARGREAVEAASTDLADHLERHRDLDLDDVAWTLDRGRRRFPTRRALVARSADEARELLRSGDQRRVITDSALSSPRQVALMFPGGGSQHLGMAAGLYRDEPEFARHIDAGLALLDDEHAARLRRFLLDETSDADAEAEFERMANQLPAIFLVEYALAALLRSWDVEFDALIGHSVGENTAACVAGTISFADCLGLVRLRGTLMDRVAGGALAVPLAEAEVVELADRHGLDIAVINAPELTVVSGPTDGLDGLAAELAEDGVEAQRVRLNVAAHSRVLDPVLAEFRSYLDSITLHPPTVRWVSNRTGTWITDAEATDPGYWVDHIRNTVRFADGIATLAEAEGRAFLEVGPGRTLASLTRMNTAVKRSQPAISLMRHADDGTADSAMLLTGLGALWASGWELPTALAEGRYAARPARQVSLPTYPFQSQTFFIAPGRAERQGGTTYVDRNPDHDQWYWKPVWRRHDLEPSSSPLGASTWLVIADQPDDENIDEAVIDELRRRGHEVVVVRVGTAFAAHSDLEYTISPANGDLDYASLWQHLARSGHLPDRVAHLALLATTDDQYRPGSTFFHHNLENGFQSLMALLRTYTDVESGGDLHLTVFTMCAQRVTDGDLVQWPEQATVLGPALVGPREFGGVTIRVCDVDQADFFATSRVQRALGTVAEAITRARQSGVRAARSAGAGVADTWERRRELIDGVVAELLGAAATEVVGLRAGQRFVADVAPAVAAEGNVRLRQGGVVLITGGLGGIGLAIAEELVDQRSAKLVLMGRRALPPRAEWADVVARLGERHPVAQRIAAVEGLEARGAEVLVVHGDVADQRDVLRVVAEARERFGAVHGIVHAAGVVDDDLIVSKSPVAADAVLAPKVFGPGLLDEATSDETLDLFVVFSSTSTATTPVGQADYVAANCFLNSWAENRRAIGRSEVVSINWGIWNEVGMAATAAAPPSPSDATCSSERAAVHPMFSTVTIAGSGVVTLRSSWSARDDWFLDEHRTAAGEALLPGSGYLELARAALAELGVAQPFEIRELTFLRPLAVANDVPTTVETVLTPTAAGYDLAVRVGADVNVASAEDGTARTRRGWKRVGEAKLLLRSLVEPAPLDLAALAAQAPERDNTRTAQLDHLRFGPRWDVVRQVRRGHRLAIATLELPIEFTDDLVEFDLHPALVDLGTGFAMNLITDYAGDTLWVPLSYRSISVFAALPRQLVSVVRVLPASTEGRGFARFDVDLCDESGRVLVAVREFTIKRLGGVLETGLNRPPAAADLEFDDSGDAAHTPSRPELVLRHNLEQGIRPLEGRHAFGRALGSGAAVLYVSSLDLLALRQQAATSGALAADDGESSAVFRRPTLASDYVEPSDERQKHLVAIWEELLGIDQVGIHDDFFALGGHSLIAVRLFSKIKRTFSVDFPISVLFEAPTVAQLAELIAAAQPATATDEGGAIVASSAPRHQYLVAMHPGEAGARTPFFLVAGMFGNVLNLRHLAELIGVDRPFYGVQARGVAGTEAPHESIPEMAAAYLDEVRRVQPEGPYLLGGFSGGGIIAYEMAQQLRAVGESTGLLVLLDTPLPQSPPLQLADKLKMNRDKLARDGVQHVSDWFGRRIDGVGRALGRSAATEQFEGMPGEHIGRAFNRAVERYELLPYDGTVTLYRPPLAIAHVFGPDRQINADRRFIFADNGWSEHVAAVDVNEVPGDHDSMVLEPHARVLARLIRERIDFVEETTPVASAVAGAPGG